MAMYKNTINKNYFNVSIDGYDLIAEEVTVNEAYNRRETSRKNIIGGTQTVIRTNYLPRDYTFITHMLIDPLHPDVYDNIFREWQSKAVEVISKQMGGKFSAECIVKPSLEDSPNYLRVEIQVIEIPDATSLIPNDTFVSPSNSGDSNLKIISTYNKNKKKNKDKSKDSKNKNTKTTKKSNKKDSKKNKKGKGNNITKTKKSK